MESTLKGEGTQNVCQFKNASHPEVGAFAIEYGLIGYTFQEKRIQCVLTICTIFLWTLHLVYPASITIASALCILTAIFDPDRSDIHCCIESP